MCNLSRKEITMPHVTVGKENSGNIDTYYKRLGDDKPG